MTAALRLLVVLGAVLRLVEFGANRSLWIDEAALASNIVSRSPAELAGRPLDHGQAAPIAFLWLEKAAASAFGESERALRLVPFAAGLASLVLFAALATRMLGDLGAITAVALFALNHRLVYYGAEIKQYGLDAAVATALLLLGARIGRPPGGVALMAAAALGTTAGWLSYPACFVLAGLGASLLLSAWRRRSPRLALQASSLGLWWAASIVPVLLLERRHVSAASSSVLGRYWSDGLPPAGMGAPGALAWTRAVSARVLAYLFEPGELGPRVSQATVYLLAALLVAGALFLARRDPERGVLVGIPVALAFAGAAFSIYPLSRRLTLYLVPMLLILAGAGVEALRSLLARRGAGILAGVPAAALVVVAGVRTISIIPDTVEELRPVLAGLAARARPDDPLYVHNGAVRAYAYYAPRLGLARHPTTLGCCHLNQWQLEIEAIRRLGPRPRIWFVFAHAQEGEADFFPAALDRLGSRLDAIRAKDAAAYLYALGPIDDAAVAEVLRWAPAARVRAEPDWECAEGILLVAPCGP